MPPARSRPLRAALLIAVLATGCSQLLGIDDFPAVHDAAVAIDTADPTVDAPGDGMLLSACASKYGAAYDGHRYDYNVANTNRADATAACIADGGHLVKIETQAESTVVDALVANHSSLEAWIGLDDIATEGSFVWFDGTPLTTPHWRAGEPSNSNNEDCVVAQANGWNDTACNTTHARICECDASAP